MKKTTISKSIQLQLLDLIFEFKEDDILPFDDPELNKLYATSLRYRDWKDSLWAMEHKEIFDKMVKLIDRVKN